MNKERTITTITLSVALAIGGTEIFNQIERFSKEAGLLKRNFKYETKSKIQMEW